MVFAYEKLFEEIVEDLSAVESTNNKKTGNEKSAGIKPALFSCAPGERSF